MNVWVVIVDIGFLFRQQFYNLERRRFSYIINVFFICKPEHKNPGALDARAISVEGFNGFLDDIIGHRGIYLSSELYEPRMKVVFPGLPGQIEGVKRNAMPPYSGTRVKRLKAKGFCLCGFYYLPYVNAHPVIKHF